MHDISEQQMRRILIVGSTAGFATLFLVFAGLFALVGVPLAEAAGIAVFPAMMGSWFYGGTILFMRATAGTSESARTEIADLPVPDESAEGAHLAA